MRTSLPVDDFVTFLARQLALFDDGRTHAPLASVVDAALQRYEFSARRIVIAPSYRAGDEPFFDHLHADQSAAFLWFAANTAFRSFEDRALATKLFLLNKLRNGLVVMYDTELPRVFCLVHTVGTVLGKAAYGEFFTAYQGVTVGADGGAVPTIGKRCSLLPGSRAIGNTTLGDAVTVAPGATIVHASVPRDTVVRGTSPDLQFRPRKRDYAALVFRPLPGDEALLG